MLLSWHNVAYYQQLMTGMREAITSGTFAAFAEGFFREYAQGDIEPWAANADGALHSPTHPSIGMAREEPGGSEQGRVQELDD